MHSRKRTGLFRRLLFLLPVPLVAVGIEFGPSRDAFAHCIECNVVPVVMRYDPRISPTPASGSGGSGGGHAQPGEEWDGTAAIPNPLNLTGSADIREFQVLPHYHNDIMTVTISWDPGPALSYDMDLYVDRFNESTGAWSEVARSANGQLLEGDAVEVATVQPPAVPTPGRYRTRVVNFASTTVAYHGEIGFASTTGGDGRPSRTRVTADRPDEAVGSQMHLIYFVPAGGQDNALDTDGTLENAIASMNLWMDGQTNGRHLRLDTYLDRNEPRADISFVGGNLTAAEYAADADGAFTAITDELEERGWTASPAAKRYLVYYEGPAEDPNICGTAFVSLDPNDFAQWSVVFLGASPGCGARDFGTPTAGAGMSEAIALQELLHNEAMAPLQAPHQCWAFNFHICTAAAGAVLVELDPESVDVMFPFVTFPLRGKQIDPGRDDYFEHPFLHRDLSDSPYLEAR